MFDHVTIRVFDRPTSEAFYGLVLPAVGLESPSHGDEFTEWGDFSIAEATAQQPVTRRLHVAFAAGSESDVDEFWRLGTEARYRDAGEPGPRPQYGESYYGGFLFDPDGTSVEAVHDEPGRRRGSIDHLWIRVSDMSGARSFYELVGSFAGFAASGTHQDPPRIRFAADDDSGSGSFSIVADGAATRYAHFAFPVADDATVDAFHRALTSARHADRGAPGERPLYHAGYYAAYVLDPDGNVVELVNHNRGS
jgi:catechol 2,3-dioxygenase-like lactoylglutathione lyase family enzyme